MAKTMVNDIIARIVEIINLSEAKEKEISKEENAMGFFTVYLGYNIANEYLLEFRDLCDAERTILVFQNTNAPLALNKKLIDKCDSLMEASEDAPLYSELKVMLMNSLAKKVDELSEINGYYVERSAIPRFKELDQKLKFTTAINYTSEEVKEQINHASLNNPSARKRRIDKYRIVNKIISFDSFKDRGSISLNMANVRQDLLNSKHLEIICLGLFGHLDLEGVKALGYIYSEKEYTDLLSELSTWGFFEPEDLLDLKNNYAITENPRLTEIIGQLALQKDLKVEGIYEFRNVEGIGEDGVKTMINILHMIKALSDEEYQKFTSFEYRKGMTKAFGVPFQTFDKEDIPRENEEFVNALIEYAKRAGLGDTEEEILANLTNNTPFEKEMKTGTSL